jgi:hypothetical protein
VRESSWKDAFSRAFLDNIRVRRCCIRLSCNVVIEEDDFDGENVAERNEIGQGNRVKVMVLTVEEVS